MTGLPLSSAEWDSWDPDKPHLILALSSLYYALHLHSSNKCAALRSSESLKRKREWYFLAAWAGVALLHFGRDGLSDGKLRNLPSRQPRDRHRSFAKPRKKKKK